MLVLEDLLVARVLGGGDGAPWTVKTGPARVRPEVYAQLSRKVRRNLRKTGQEPLEPVVAAQRPASFMAPSAAPPFPTQFMYWKRPFKVVAHVFSACPVLFQEWAGQDFKHIRNCTLRQAARHTEGLCQYCALLWQALAQVRYAA